MDFGGKKNGKRRGHSEGKERKGKKRKGKESGLFVEG